VPGVFARRDAGLDLGEALAGERLGGGFGVGH
jgi:hypothetical protein